MQSLITLPSLPSLLTSIPLPLQQAKLHQLLAQAAFEAAEEEADEVVAAQVEDIEGEAAATTGQAAEEGADPVNPRLIFTIFIALLTLASLNKAGCGRVVVGGI